MAHTATLLPNGKVLVVGGRTMLDPTKGNPLASVEIYDPERGTWTLDQQRQLKTARSGHTATLLPSGKVLIAGGAGIGSSPLDRTELYDPENGWTSTGSLKGARFEHTAMLLATGRVLVAGGFDGAPVGSAELYNPDSGTWSFTGPLLIPRRQATASLLPAGRVLLAGGFSAGRIAETEIYDPKTGRWIAGKNLTRVRNEHSALLLPSGTALFLEGGTAPPTP